MNLKRVFLAATAALMLPGFAMAQGITITFDTQLETSNGADVDVVATLTCNTGNPLVQSLPIDTNQGVVFVVENFEGSPAIGCSISIDDVNTGYEMQKINANSIALNPALTDSCNYTETAVAGISVAGLVDNECIFVLAPEAFSWTINKDWDFSDNTDVAQIADFYWYCNNAMDDIDDDNPGQEDGYFTLYAGDDDYTIDWLYPNPDSLGGRFATNCFATETLRDSAVESDQGCNYGTSFELGDDAKSCLVTNTVFFEGIPTLSQYGLAIMALLMLGVGFVGFRRFV